MWRVQATSGTGQGPKEWSPFLVRTRFGAWRAARAVRRTLVRFPDVRVRIRRATAADVEEVRRLDAERNAGTAAAVIHRAEAPGAQVTVCGLPRTGLTALVLTLDLWGDSPRHCPGCHPAGRHPDHPGETPGETPCETPGDDPGPPRSA